MENPNPKNNDELSRRSISDLPDKQLSEILIRLPCYKTVITCKFVSKHWLSMLSNPKFVIEFVNHKKKKQSLLPWTFNILRREKLIKDKTTDDDESFIDTHNKVFYRPRKFSLNFLPLESGSFKSIATFKDLILCIDVHYKYHYICNPVTKRWVALPPIPVSLTQHRFWSCLVCEDPFNNDNNNNIDDYKFRVVVVPYLNDYRPKPYAEKSPFITLKVFVFCSESCEWVDVDVKFPLHTLGKPCVVAHPPKAPSVRKGVVCKGMVCFCYDVYFGLFDPFKVITRGCTIEARYLPIPYAFDRTKLVDWNGRLISFFPNVYCSPYIIEDGNILMGDGDQYISIEIRYQELDLNQVLLNPNNNNDDYEVCWTTSRRNRICIDKTKTGRSLPLSLLHGVRMMNIHPTKKHVFFILTANKELILCDTESSTLKTLGRSRNQDQSCRISKYENIMNFRSDNHTRLELQYWPTPLPTIPPSPSPSPSSS